SCFMLPALVLYIAIPTLKKAKEGRTHYNTLQRFKHNDQVFDAILSRQKKVVPSAEGLGITIGNPDAKWKLIKVCNPYCGPCARAHPVIEELVESNADLQVQIIFTATGEEADIKTPPVKHLLAIAADGNEKATRQALDDWYNAPVKDYKAFTEQYPLPDELLAQQKDKIVAMKKWCDDMEIQFTPTFFVNGYQLPEVYNVAELKYFLTE
ncbi:MAG: thioredoxin domain-containing protein, partial [Bacteroidetes bacterium]|nr:thioredoxin domain-containing protein [Bacteroidota bacterium]